MSELLSDEVVDMVVCLTEDLAQLGVMAARAGVAASTIRAWERCSTVPSLPLFLRCAAVHGRRMALVDTCGRRWDTGVTSFGPVWWGDQAWLETFAALETSRLMVALGRARRAKGLPVERLGCPHVDGAALWGSGHGLPDLELVVHRAASVGLCASLEPVADLPEETPDEDPAALRPDQDEIRS